MIYQLTNMVVVPGKIAEYFKNAEPAQPLYPKVGIKIEGSWHGYTGDMNIIYVLYSYKDLAAYGQARAAMAKDADFRKTLGNVYPLITRQTNILLEPNPWSPMK